MKPKREVNWRHEPKSPRASWTKVPVQPDEMSGRLGVLSSS